jgi:predicted ester cyclase
MLLPGEYAIEGQSLRAAVTASRIETFTRRYYGLFNERRFEEAEALVDPQAVFTYPAAKEHFIGRAGYRELAHRWAQAFPDATLSITRVTVSGETALTEWIGRGTHLGILELPGFPGIPPTGRKAQLPMRETIRVVNDRIVESRMEFDPLELRQRLGL